jgi:pyruvate/2-oxoacid:ferredoxin oxidoreductase beta subunit
MAADPVGPAFIGAYQACTEMNNQTKLTK